MLNINVNEKMENKVAGVVLIESIFSNYNADFNSRPKKINGKYIASPPAIKYAIRNTWKQKSEKVFYTKSINVKDSSILRVNTIKERYDELFNEGKKTGKEGREVVLNNLMTCIDVENFGATFAESEVNISLTGAAQFTEGINLYPEAKELREDLLTPFSVNDNEKSTLGERVVLDEAYFAHGLTVNPFEYMELNEKVKDFKGYTKGGYLALKEACLTCGNDLRSLSKEGCGNTFSMFVEFKKGSLVSIANLQRYMKEITKEGNKIIIDLSTIEEYLSSVKDEIDVVEIYFNPVVAVVKNDPNSLNYKMFNILSKKPI